MPRKPLPGWDPQPHPRDIPEMVEWYRRHGAGSAEAFEYARARHERWATERSHFQDKLMLAIALFWCLVLLIFNGSGGSCSF